MNRMLALLLVWFLLAAGMAHAVPARPPYEPEPPPKPVMIDLRDTSWAGKLFSEGEQVTFHADGTLTYGKGTLGVWRLTGSQLYFEINRWSEYHVTVVGDIIHGVGTNKNGQKCQPYLNRVRLQDKAKW